MKMKILVALIIGAFSLSVFGQEDWQKQIEKIRPLITTEAEVEKILGKATERFSNIGEYNTKDGRFDVWYSEGKCLPVFNGKYNVEKGVIILYNFRPKKKIKFASLGIDVSGLETVVPKDMWPPPITYYNPDKGIDYTVYKGILNFVYVYQSNDLDNLQCSE